MRNKAESLVELIAMNATGEITDAEFEQAKRLIEEGKTPGAAAVSIPTKPKKETSLGAHLSMDLHLLDWRWLVHWEQY